MTHPPGLQTFGEYYNVLDLVLPDHPPEVSYGVGHWTWGHSRDRERGKMVNIREEGEGTTLP